MLDYRERNIIHTYTLVASGFTMGVTCDIYKPKTRNGECEVRNGGCGGNE